MPELKVYTDEEGNPRHDSFGYRGEGIYACSCGHILNDEGDAETRRPAEALLYANKGAVADLKVAHLAHRLEVEPEALGQ